MKYEVEFFETITHKYVVIADSVEQAEASAERVYYEGEDDINVSKLCSKPHSNEIGTTREL